MSTIDVETERLLQEAARRGHRRVVVRRAVTSVAVGVALVITAALAPAVLGALHDQRNAPASKPSPLPIAGSYTTTITAQDPGISGAPDAVGRWVLTLGGDGQLDLASLTNGDLARSITEYQATQTELLTTALGDAGCTGVGRYTWSREGSTLTFTVVSDPCRLRAAIFSSRAMRATWTSCST
jgi:hypothetical protein